MRILIATTFVPFAPGTEDRAADALAAALVAHRPGAAVDRVRLPRGEHLALAARLTDLGDCERLVTVGAGAAGLVHPAVRSWDPGEAPDAAPSAAAWAPIVETLLR